MKNRLLPVATLLFISGMCSLIFQVGWMREFRLVFGATTAATAAVTAIFMGGLGLGNAWLGRYADRSPNPLLFYSKLEILTGLSAALTPLLIDFIRWSYVLFGGQTALTIPGATLVRLILSAVVLGVPTILMGGTLPALARAVTNRDDPHRRAVGVLYGVNTLGAVLGAAICTFVLLELLGTRTTIWLTAGVNIVEGILAYQLSRIFPRPAAGDRPKVRREPSENVAAPAAEPGHAILSPRLVYAAAAIVGFTFFLMELVWFRMLGPVLGGTTFTFGLILVVALFGIGLGGAAYHFIFRDTPPSVHSFAMTCALEALFIAYPYALGDRIAVLALVLRDLSGFGFAGQAVGWAVVAGIVILPAAFVAGVQFPVLIGLIGRAEESIGRQVGNAFAWNTVGAIAGSLAGGFGALPLFSAPGAWIMVVILLCLLGVALLVVSYRSEKKNVPGLALSYGLIVLALLALRAEGPTKAWRHAAIGAGRAKIEVATQNGLRRWRHDMQRWIIVDVEGVEASVAMAAEDGLSFIVNGKSDGNALEDADSFIMPGLIGGLLHPRAETGFVVGLGTGETAGWLAEIESIRQVDVIELEPVIDQMAVFCKPINFDVLNHPKVRLFHNDAREALLTTSETYDLIVSQPSNPYRAGVAGLFTREYYKAVIGRLRPQGIFLQWMQAYEIDPDTVATVIATLRSEFGHVEIWQTNATDMLFVCSMEPIAYPVSRLRQRVAEEPYRSATAITWRAVDLEGVLARYLGGPKLVDAIRARVKHLNTDDMNYLEYGSARTVGRSTSFSLPALREHAIRLGNHRPPVIGGEIDWLRVEDQRMTMTLADRVVHQHSIITPDQQMRAQALLRFTQHDMAATIALWRQQPRQPNDPTELAVLARAYAELGDEEALPLIEKLAAFNAIEAEAYRALLLYRQNKIEETADSLEKVFLGLRVDPWPQMIEHVFAVAHDMVRTQRDPKLALRMYEALKQRFAVYKYRELRRTAAYHCAAIAGPEPLAEAVYTFEPKVPWTKSFLVFRLQAYTAVNHPLAPLAKAELEEYLAHEPDETIFGERAAAQGSVP